MDETCVCGDVADEHERTRTGYGACEVEGCPCFHFEADPDAGEVIEDEAAIDSEDDDAAE